MTEEIKKLIDEEAERIYLIPDDYGFIDKSDMDRSRAFKAGSNFILSKWQEADRWRKFGTDDLPNLGMRILLKNGNRLDVTVVHSHQHIHELAECFTEWKPIS